MTDMGCERYAGGLDEIGARGCRAPSGLNGLSFIECALFGCGSHSEPSVALRSGNRTPVVVTQ